MRLRQFQIHPFNMAFVLCLCKYLCFTSIIAIDLQIMILEGGENQTGSLMVHSCLQRPELGQEASRGTDYNL